MLGIPLTRQECLNIKQHHKCGALKKLTITNYGLKQQLKNITNTSTGGKVRSVTSGVGGGSEESEEIPIAITNKKFNKIGNYGKEIIFYDNSKAFIPQPMPCMKWMPKKAPDSTGTVTLNKELTATVLTVGNENVVLGFHADECGVCTELELLIDLGDSELLMNNEFYSIKAKTHVKDGVKV